MYQEWMEKLNPKPEFDLQWYHNEDLYSEGDVEDQIISLIAKNNPEEYEDAVINHYSWSTYYHLNLLRKNILNWYPFKQDANVLEIGCGMGAITNLLCDKCKSVTAVELSKKRATAALFRCRERENLKIIVGNLNDIEFEEKFDYITLIGVLEYQGKYTNSDNPFRDFLVKIKGLLKPGGKLLIAIENQYGLKYWCGAKEDHVGLPFEGINQYYMTGGDARTFSKSALEGLVKESGFEKCFFYYPMPDYKLPTVVYSQEYLPSNENMHDVRFYYAPDDSTVMIQEEKVYMDIIENHVFEFFANSFLVECADTSDVGEVTFAVMSSERQQKYRIGTKFTRDGKVIKFPLIKEKGEQHIMQIKKNGEALKARKINVWVDSLEDGKLVSEFCNMSTWEQQCIEFYKKRNYEKIYSLFDKLYAEILKSSDQAEPKDNILFDLEVCSSDNPLKYGPILKVGFLDMILRNAFLDGEAVYWFDQEWILENIPAGFVLFRAIKYLYNSFPELNNILNIKELSAHFQLEEVWQDYCTMDELFANTVLEEKHILASSGFRYKGAKICLQNLKKLLV